MASASRGRTYLFCKEIQPGYKHDLFILYLRYNLNTYLFCI